MNEENKKSEISLPINLPASDNPYWEFSEKIKTTNIPVNKDCQHYFLLVNFKETQCKFCRWGLFLGPGDEVKQGHLYHDNNLVI